jgi:membrane protein DedA with SNARE-associated domain
LIVLDPISVLLILLGISFLSNATPFFGASYTLLGAGYLAQMPFDGASFAAVVLVTAVGASVAKIVIYFGGLGFGTKLRENKNVQLLGKWLGERSFYTAVFVAALIPVLPLDDYIYIGAGANKGRLLPMLGVTVPAKVAKSAIEIWIEITGLLAINGLIRGLGLNSLTLSIVLSLGFVVLGYILYKIDWQEVLKGRITRAQ